MKVLVLGGKPIGSCEMVEAIKKRGYYAIVADYLMPEESEAKKIANEHWEISTADIDELAKKCLENNVSAVLTGVHEFNIERKIELCDKMNLPQYCTIEQWNFCENKADFKELCRKHNIDVAKTYEKNDRIDFPVIVKPVDSSGSRGFSICHDFDELKLGIKHALDFSESKKYLIEEYMNCEACIVHYTAINGEIIFSGMSDKHSQILKDKSSVMAFQSFPSTSIERYLNEVNEKVISMFKDIGIMNGPIWIEVFNEKKTGRFVFNEMGYRFGGSMTNYPVKHFYGIDQIELMIDNAVGNELQLPNLDEHILKTSYYCILPIHIEKGKIFEIRGITKSKKITGVEKIVMVHYVGDQIQDWGTAQQVFCYLHISYDTAEQLAQTIGEVKKSLSVIDENGNEMLYYLYDLSSLGVN